MSDSAKRTGLTRLLVPHNRYRSIIALALTASWAPATTALGQEGGTLQPALDRLPSEAAVIWEKATSPAHASECIIRMTDPENGDRLLSSTKRRVNSSGPCYLWSNEYLSFDDPDRKTARSRASCRNSKYEFELEKRHDQDDWLLAYWKFAGEEKHPERPPVNYEPRIHDHFAHLTVGQQPISVAVKEPGWKLKSVSPSPADGRLLRVTFDYRYQPKPNINSVLSGWVDLDRQAGWCVRESDLVQVTTFPGKSAGATIQTRYSARTKYEYDLDSRGVPVLKTMHADGVNEEPVGGKKRRAERRLEFTTTYPGEIAEREFTLSAFGLPEPEGVVWDKPTPTYVWILAAACGSAILALGFRFLARHKAHPRPA